MSEFKIIEAEEPQPAQPAQGGSGSFVIRDYDEPRQPSPAAAASVGASKQLQELEQRRAQEAEEARLRTQKLGETGTQALSGFGSAANTLTSGFFPYIPAGLAKGAGYLGVPGYEYAKDMPMMELKKKAEGIVSSAEEQYPKTSYAGTAAGIGLGAATLPTFAAGKAPWLSGAATGAVYGGLGGLSKEMDWRDALLGAGLGAGAGAVITPVVEKVASKFITSIGGKHNVLDDNGNLSFKAVTAAKQAGMSDEEIAALTPVLKQVMSVRGPTKEAAREARFAEFDLTPTKGMVGKGEAQLNKEARYGAPAFERLQNEAAAAAERVAGGAQPELRDAITIAVDKAGKNAADLKKQVDAAYAAAANAPGAFTRESIENVGQKILSNWAKDDKLLDLYGNDIANKAVKELDSVLGAVLPTSGGVGVVHRTFNAVESGRKILNNAFGAAKTNTDRAAVRKLIEDFDNHIESSINSGAFSGDKAVLQQWKDARKLFSQYQNKFGVKKSGEEAGSLLKSIIEGNKSADEVANMMFNFANSGDATMKATAFKTMAQLRRALGPNSPELDTIKNSFVQQMMTPKGDVSVLGNKVFGDTAKQINGLLSGRAQGVANRLFTGEERQVMQRYAKVMEEAASKGMTPAVEAKFRALKEIAMLSAPSIASGAANVLGYFHPVLAAMMGAPFGVAAGVKAYGALPAVASKAANAPIKGAPVPVPGVRTAVPLSVEEYMNSQRSRRQEGLDQDVQAASSRDLNRLRQGRKEGGRVDINFEKEADQLINKAARAHKQHQKDTEPLLATDDNTIAKALEVAQRHI